MKEENSTPLIGPNAVLEWLSKLAGAITLGAAYVGFTGWTYLAEFYGEFGIGLGSLDIPFATYSMNAFQVFSSWRALFWLSILGIALFLMRKTKMLEYASILCLVMLFPILYSVAVKEGHLRRRSAEETQPRVALTFKSKEFQEVDPEFSKANADGKLRLLMLTKDSVLAFHQPGITGMGTDHVYTFQRADLLAIHITAR